MSDDVKSINQHPDALTEYPSISPADVNILVERKAAGTEPENQEHLKVSLADLVITQAIVRGDQKHVPSNKAIYDVISNTRVFLYVGEFSSATPENPRKNDMFKATATFVEDGVTYTQNRFYAWSESTQTWGDVTDILAAYASLARQYAEGKKIDGTDVVSGEPGYHNNAKYWAEQAALQSVIWAWVLQDDGNYKLGLLEY